MTILKSVARMTNIDSSLSANTPETPVGVAPQLVDIHSPGRRLLHDLKTTFKLPRFRPVESHSGARETIIAAPYHNLTLYAPKTRRPRRRNFGVEKGGNVRGVPTHHPTRDLWKHRKLPQRGPRRGPGRKWILCIFEVRKTTYGRHFSVLSGTPPTSRSPGKVSTLLSLLPPFRRACLDLKQLCELASAAQLLLGWGVYGPCRSARLYCTIHDLHIGAYTPGLRIIKFRKVY